jgi:hypothetical protein
LYIAVFMLNFSCIKKRILIKVQFSSWFYEGSFKMIWIQTMLESIWQSRLITSVIWIFKDDDEVVEFEFLRLLYISIQFTKHFSHFQI